jgi:hypothetical protein
MDARVSSLHEAIEIVCASPHVGQRCVTHHHGCVDRLFMRTREEEVTLEVILYEYSRRLTICGNPVCMATSADRDGCERTGK